MADSSTLYWPGNNNQIYTTLVQQQETAKRAAKPGRSKRETYLWEMIDRNIFAEYQKELV